MNRNFENVRDLQNLEILGTPHNPRFDEILENLTASVGCNNARISFIDSDRIWTMSKKGNFQTEFPRLNSVEDSLVQSGQKIITVANGDLNQYQDPINFEKNHIQEIYAIGIRDSSSTTIGCILLAFESKQTFSLELQNIFIDAALKCSELIDSSKDANFLLATLRDQQEEIRIRYSSERIARTLGGSVTGKTNYHQVVESFVQTILNEFDWWGAQIWHQDENQLLPEKWIFGPSTPRAIMKIESIFTPPIHLESNYESGLEPFTSKVSPLLESSSITWAYAEDSFEAVGIRTVVEVGVTGPSSTALKILFALPGTKSLPSRLRITFENSISLLPQLVRRARAVEELNYRATHDELTGLLNRRGLDLAFPENSIIDGLRRHNTIFFLDIDRFKLVNDTYGHQVGDQLLAEFSQRLLKCSRPVDTIARIGGDEFVIVSPGFDHIDEISQASHRFLQQLGETFTATDGTTLDPKVSIGVSIWDSTELFSKAISVADKNMYMAKNRGGNQAVSDGWMSSDSSILTNGEDYEISYQSIKNRNKSEDLGILARVTLPSILAPKIVSEIAKQIYSRAQKVDQFGKSNSILLLDIIASSRADRVNTLALIDSLTELVADKTKITSMVNLDDSAHDATQLAREILEHGKANVALGNVFDRPVDIEVIADLKPAFVVRPNLPAGWENTEIPVLADRASLSIAADIGIPVVLPIEYSTRYEDYLAKYSHILYLNNEKEK